MSYGQAKGITLDVIQEELDKIRLEAAQEASKRLLAVVCVNLQELYGFGPKRLERLLLKVNKTFTCLDEDLQLEAFVDYCKTEIGIDLDKM